MGFIRKETEYISESEKVELFTKVIPVLNRSDILYWLDFGTLLGFVREGRFIEWDADIDIGVFDLESVCALSSVFEGLGLKTEMNYRGIKDMTPFLRVHGDSLHVDIYGFEEGRMGAILQCNRYKNIVSRIFRSLYLHLRKKGHESVLLLKSALFFSQKRVFMYPMVKTRFIQYYGLPVKIPVRPERHLRLMYGDDWMTPTKDDVAGRQHIIAKKRNITYYGIIEEW